MAKLKQSTGALHDAALQLCASMLPDKKEVGAQKTLASMRERNKETKDKLRGVFAQMQTQFEAGEQIGGCTSMKQWCKTYKSHGALTYARVRQILTGTNGHEKRSSRLTFKSGATFTFNGQEYRIEDRTGQGDEHILSMSVPRHKVPVHFSFVA